MAKLKTNRLVKKICDNCHGNGYVRIAVGNTSIDLEITVRCTNVGYVTQREKYMKKGLILLMIVIFLTSCTKLEFDGFDPATSIFKWTITNETK